MRNHKDTVIDQNTSLFMDGAMSVADAVTFSGIGRTTLYELMRAGRLPSISLGRKRLVPKAALVQLLVDIAIGGAP